MRCNALLSNTMRHDAMRRDTMRLQKGFGHIVMLLLLLYYVRLVKPPPSASRGKEARIRSKKKVVISAHDLSIYA